MKINLIATAKYDQKGDYKSAEFTTEKEYEVLKFQHTKMAPLGLITIIDDRGRLMKTYGGAFSFKVVKD